MKIKILELFAGIGACSKALKNIGIDVEIVDAVEIDKYAIKSFNAVHNTDFEPQDITKWDKDIEVDLITHGSPCQDFSVAGKQAGGDKDSGTRSSLMYETIRIVEKLKPKYVLWENVKNLLSKKHRHNFDAYIETMNNLGYNSYYQVLNAKDYGIPQNRERVYTVSILRDKQIYDDYNSNIRKDQDTIGTLTTNCGSSAIRNGWKVIELSNDFVFPEKEELKLKLKDILEDKVDEKYYLSNKTIKTLRNAKIEADITNREIADKLNIPLTKVEHYFRKDNSFAIPEAQIWLQLKEVLNIETDEFDKSIMTFEEKEGVYEKANRYYLDNGIAPTLTQQQENVITNLRIRKLTPLECWRLMGFDDEDFYKAEKVNSNTQLYKEAGNSICVPVLEKIFTNLFYGSQNSEQTLFDIEVKYDNNKR